MMISSYWTYTIQCVFYLIRCHRIEHSMTVDIALHRGSELEVWESHLLLIRPAPCVLGWAACNQAITSQSSVQCSQWDRGETELAALAYLAMGQVVSSQWGRVSRQWAQEQCTVTSWLWGTQTMCRGPVSGARAGSPSTTPRRQPARCQHPPHPGDCHTQSQTRPGPWRWAVLWCQDIHSPSQWSWYRSRCRNDQATDLIYFYRRDF